MQVLTPGKTWDVCVVGTFVAEWRGCPPQVLAKIGIGEEPGSSG